ncbi:MAG: alpha/beta hydrolase [Candidatus Dormibacteraceae bacterium]
MAVVLPALLLLLWDRTPPRQGLNAFLLSLAFDPVRSAIIGELIGILLAALITALLSRPLVTWLAAGCWFGILFVAFLPFRMAPKTLPFEVVDQKALVISLVGVAALGFAAAGVGAGAGAALRVGIRRLLSLRYGLSRRGQVLVACLLLLAVPSVYGVAQAPNILIQGPYAGVVQSNGKKPSGPLSPSRQINFYYHSDAFQMERNAIVILPPGYDSNPNQRYPVIYLLHGSPGMVSDWLLLQPEAIAEQVHAAGKAPRVILVLVNGVGPRGGSDDSFANGYVPGDNMASDFLGSLIPAIDHQLRTEQGTAHRWICGYSTGGYGAANLALQHPNLFGVSVVLSVDPLQPPSSSFGANVQEQNANNPLKLAQRAASPGDPDFFVSWGRSDPAAPQSVQFIDALRQNGYTFQSDPQNGGHDGLVWKTGYYDALLALGTRLGNPSN